MNQFGLIGDHASRLTVFLCACTSARQCGFLPWFIPPVPALGSHTLISWSLLPVRMMPLVGCHRAALTSHPWPFRQTTSCEVSRSQIDAVWSSLHDTKWMSLGANEMSRTGSLCARNALMLFIVDCQYLMMPPSSAVSISRSLCDHVMTRTGSWCASATMPSKLNWSPFH